MGRQLYIDVSPQPGIQRDGTSFDTLMYTDGSWVRFYKMRAKKMGGYQILHFGTQEIVRDLFSYDFTSSVLVYMGRASSLSYIQVSPDGTTSSPVDRTPAGFVVDPENTWVFSTVNADNIFILATAAPNNIDIANEVPGRVYYGLIDDSTPLAPLLDGLNPIETTGGVFVLLSFIIVYGSDGRIFWNDGLSFFSWPVDNQTTIGTSKIVYAAPVRAGDTASGLLWSLDSVIKITYVTDQNFIASYISTTSTILSANCVVNYEPFFFWIGNDSFYIYNGTVSELPNTINKDWFFKNLNETYKEKVWGFVNRQFGEICWLFPYGDSTENNHMLVYNIQDQTWFDTDQIDRCSAVASTSQFQYPIMSSSAPEPYGSSFLYPLWMHERGVNKVAFGESTPITSTFTTNINNMWMEDPQSQVCSVDMIAPDVEQAGTMIMQVITRGYPNSTPTYSDDFPFDPDTEFRTVRVKGSFFAFKFISNVIDGDYLMGKTMARINVTDDQRPGPTS